MNDISTINYLEIDSFLKNSFAYETEKIVFKIKEPSPDYGSINNSITPADDILQEKIRKTILSKELDEVDIYKKADVDRKLFSKIRTQPDYHPNKNTILKLCLAMNLNTAPTGYEAKDVISIDRLAASGHLKIKSL